MPGLDIMDQGLATLLLIVRVGLPATDLQSSNKNLVACKLAPLAGGEPGASR